ncbi:MAG: PASTA domain-containing protein [Gemmatimonadota bacterium]
MSYRRRRGLAGRRGRNSRGREPSRNASPSGAGGREARRTVAQGALAGVRRVRNRLGDLRLPARASTRGIVSAFAVLLFFAAGYLISATWLFPAERGSDAGSLVEVPELVGLSSEEARGRVERLGFSYTVRSSIAHPDAPEGAVLAQNPLPGQMARPGAPVHVTLSRGPERRTLPDVAGLSARQARIVLERLGFTPRVRETESPVEKGRAVRTSPEAGSELPVPAEVELLVSSGPPVVIVPKLTGRHFDDVAELLATHGLELGQVTFDPVSFAAPGRITGQYPPAGYSLREGGTVEVRVAGSSGDLRSPPRTPDLREPDMPAERPAARDAAP